MDDLYQEHILEHYRNPSHKGAPEGNFLAYTAQNRLCGDELTVFLSVEEGKIVHALFSGEGCALSQAAADIVCEEVEGKEVTDAAGLSPGDVYDMIGVPVTPARAACALLGYEAVQGALRKKHA